MTVYKRNTNVITAYATLTVCSALAWLFYLPVAHENVRRPYISRRKSNAFHSPELLLAPLQLVIFPLLSHQAMPSN